MNENLTGELLKEIRESKKFTQDEVANLLKVGRNAIVRMESNNRKVSEEELKKLEPNDTIILSFQKIDRS